MSVTVTYFVLASKCERVNRAGIIVHSGQLELSKDIHRIGVILHGHGYNTVITPDHRSECLMLGLTWRKLKIKQNIYQLDLFCFVFLHVTHLPSSQHQTCFCN